VTEIEMAKLDVKGIAPTVRPEAQPYWSGAARGVLSVEHCARCDRYTFPPAGWCRECRSDAIEHVDYCGLGHVVSWTINRVPWLDGMRVPFALGYVEFTDLPQVRIPCRLRVPFERLAVGLAVQVGFEPGPGGVSIPSFVLPYPEPEP
jgi:uncharacterized OB-fold protein